MTTLQNITAVWVLLAQVAAQDTLLPLFEWGVVLLDGAGTDVPRQVAGAKLGRMRELYKRASGDDGRAQREASPVPRVESGKTYPPFLRFHEGRHQDSREQSEFLAAKLREAGGQARSIHAPNKNHLTLNRKLGLPGDGPTGNIFAFLEGVLGGE